MFGYVRPAQEKLTEEDRQRFQAVYCGLCHTLKRRYGQLSRFILNYDLVMLAMLLSGGAVCDCDAKRCAVHPLKKRPCMGCSDALDTAADYSVILTWWQLRDGVTDHGFWGSLKYRLLSRLLRRAYQKAKKRQPMFDHRTAEHLQELAQLEQEQCLSIDRPADTFARLLAGAADSVENSVHRRVLQQMLYHLGRWIYLADAADDLKKDLKSGNYNPLALRYEHTDGVLTEESRRALARTMDQSIRMMAAAFELADFGVWTNIIRSTVYQGLYVVGTAVLDGTFRRRPKKDNPTRKAGA
ncbi:MAG: hypothetical protein KBS74_06090 [Clostridiales bacterium]|nr:hypothetical protein [Candidatus Cacconaster stercorequi]